MNLPAVQEVAVRATHNGRSLFEWRCTPADLEALVIGRCYCEGLLVSGFDVRHQNDEVEIVVREVGSRQAAARGGLAIPDTDAFAELFRIVFAQVDERFEHGGMHAAALTDGARIVFQAEDVGRHNTIDKVVGLAVGQRSDLSAFGLLVTARVSGEIARKAAAAGVAWIASRSIPTTMAVATASRERMAIIGRAAGKNAMVYR